MALGALTTSNAGLQAASSFLDVTSNNVANADTPGYKASLITFQDLLYSGFGVGSSTGQGTMPPGSTQIGTGAILDAICGRFTQGTLAASTGKFDLAITGEGFFAVTFPDGTTAYTRAGDFASDNTGQLVTPEGFRLAPTIIVPPNTTDITVGRDGTVTATTPVGTQPVGQLALTRFANPGGLSRLGDNVFTESAASGTATTGAPNTNGLGNVTQGFLEQSNVNLPNELVNLIIAQRAFSSNTQAIQIESQVLQTTFELIR